MSSNSNKLTTIASWNINGLRAIYKKGALQDFFTKHNCDIICLQETKCSPDQLSDELKNPSGYTGYFSWSKVKKGYSGVCVYTKETPITVTDGINDTDPEGRVLTLVFKNFVLINCYFPNGGQGPHRIEYKLDFYKRFLAYIQTLRKKHKTVIFCGDVNTAHTAIDLARPKENEKNTGFLPVERAWIDKVITTSWIDIWRATYVDKVQYTYWDQKTGARARNVGWRIDYFFINKESAALIKECSIEPDVLGSDHCPVIIKLRQE